MPTGKIRWFDSKKGYGFIAGEDGKEVYLSASNLPSSFTPKSGMKVEYSEIEEAGRMQALWRMLTMAARLSKPKSLWAMR